MSADLNWKNYNSANEDAQQEKMLPNAMRLHLEKKEEENELVSMDECIY